MREIRFNGMKRSGNHGILNWMGAQMGGVTFINDSDIWEGPQRKKGELLPDVEEGEDVLLIGYEDQHPDDIFDPEITDACFVQLIRDPRNMMASRWKLAESLRGKQDRLTGKWVLDMWCVHARKYLEYEGLDRREDRVGIKYDDWLCHLSYREKVAARLGVELKNDEARLSMCQGRGSSFSKMENPGGDALDRWQHIEGTWVGDMIEEHRELLALWEIIFH